MMGEDWVFAKDRGAVGFIGHSAYGLSGKPQALHEHVLFGGIRGQHIYEKGNW